MNFLHMIFQKAGLSGEINKTVRGQAQSYAKAACPPHAPPLGHARDGVGECGVYRTKKDLGFVQGSFFVARKYDEKYKKYRLNTVTVRSVSEKIRILRIIIITEIICRKTAGEFLR